MTPSRAIAPGGRPSGYQQAGGSEVANVARHGGRIGEDAHLSLEPMKSGIPLEDEFLIPELVEILKNEFGAVDKKMRKRDKLKKLLGMS